MGKVKLSELKANNSSQSKETKTTAEPKYDKMLHENDPRKSLAQKLSAQCSRLGIARDNKTAFFRVFYKLAQEEERLPVEQQVHGYAAAAKNYGATALTQIYTESRKCWPLDKRSALQILAGDPFVEIVKEPEQPAPQEDVYRPANPPKFYADAKSEQQIVYDLYLSQEFNEPDTVQAVMDYVTKEEPSGDVKLMSGKMIAPRLLQLYLHHRTRMSRIYELLANIDWVEDVATKGPDSVGERSILVLD